MRARTQSHAPYRELLAARLDRPLTRMEIRSLTAHLKACAACRGVDAEYRAGRDLLRSLPQPLPPRDLWARTSAALDHEVARGASGAWSRRARRMRRKARPASGLLTTLAALGVITAVTVFQVTPTAVPGTSAPLRPTPFAVNPETLAFVGLGPGDIAIYRTVVRQVCPASAPLDCVATERIERTSVAGRLPSDIHAGNIALSPNGRELAFVGRHVDSDVIAVVMMSSMDEPSAPAKPTESVGNVEPTENAVEPTQPPETPTPPPATPAPTSTPIPATPAASDEPTAIASGSPDSSATPDGSSTPSSPGATPDAQTPDAQTPAPTATPALVTPTPEPTPTPAATSTPAPTDAPPTPPGSAVPGLAVLNILENVRSAGAPPAWSRNGELLAFSAMPVDGSHGPDVYVWAPGDRVARPVTSDHASYFASWSGNRIVVSRITVNDDGDVDPLTFVLDPRSLEERPVAAPPVWLPAVSMDRMRAVVWSGELAIHDGRPTAVNGGLYVMNWSLIDPFRPSDSESTSPAPEDDPDRGRGGDSAVGLAPFEPDRDPRAAPVVDWNVRWSPDSRVLGVWIADVEGSPWGGLTVLAVDPVTRRLIREEPLLTTTLARRGFSLSDDRVAWVAPSDDNVDGELRIRAWTEDGVGGLRVVSPDSEEVLPAL